MKLVEPGYGPSTSFTNNGASRMSPIPDAYAPFAERVLAGVQDRTTVTTAADVAEAVWDAATDTSGRLRFPAGADALPRDFAHARGGDR